MLECPRKRLGNQIEEHVRLADYKGTMYDVFTTRYEFSCPERGEAQVALSSFRRIEELPGAAHPAVYEDSFDCGCGGRVTLGRGCHPRRTRPEAARALGGIAARHARRQAVASRHLRRHSRKG